MIITEETESEYRSELTLWENTHGEIWIQIGYDDNEPCETQGIAITTDDAKALINELTRLIKGIEKQSIEPPMLGSTPEETPKTGQQLTLSKVNWK